jgi:hypothetical protein
MPEMDAITRLVLQSYSSDLLSQTQTRIGGIRWERDLPRIEKSLQSSDDEENDAEGKVGDLRSRLAKRFPSNTTQDTSSDQEGTKSAKHVKYYPSE